MFRDITLIATFTSLAKDLKRYLPDVTGAF